MELDPGQPVFVKEVSGNVWKTATVDQPAAEPDSYWVRFPDNSILRRTRSMIKPRSQPSHLKLQAEAQPWNFEGKLSPCSSDSFNQMKVESMLPVTPMESVTTPATKDRGSEVRKPTNPISSTEVPSLLRVEPHPVFLQHQGVPPIPQKVFHQSDLHHQRNNCLGIQWKLSFHLCRIMQCSVIIRTISI